MAAHIHRAASQPGFLHAASGSKSSGANNSSHSSGPSVHPTSHIRCGTITPLPTLDRMRRSNTTGLASNRRVKADPKEVADFRSVLKAGGFPLLLQTVWTPTLCIPDMLDRPGYFLTSLSNLAMSLIIYGAPCITYFVLLLLLPCYIYDAVLILTLGYPLFTNMYVS